MTNQETLELALNALKCLFGLPDKFTGEGGDVAVWRLGGSYRAQEAIKALEEALAKQEQGEPVAWIYKGDPYFDGDNWCEKYELTDSKQLAFWKDKDAKPLYTTPQQRIWVGLTNDECVEIAARGYPRWLEFAQAVEAKLKEKNT